MVEEGGKNSMKYVIPAIEVVGTGTELVQSFAGPYSDFGYQALSYGLVPHDEPGPEQE